MFQIDEDHVEHVRTADALCVERERADVVVWEFLERGYRTSNQKFYQTFVIPLAIILITTGSL